MSSLEQQAVISVSDALVHDFLVKNGHEQIADELLTIRRYGKLPNLHGIDLKSVTSQFCVKKASENQVWCNDTKCANNFVFKYLLINGHVCTARDFKGCTQSRLKEDNHKDLHLQDLVEHYEAFNFNDRNKWIPIQEVFGDKLELIDELNGGQSEVGKALRYILDSNIPVRKEQAVAAKLNLKLSLDENFRYPKKANPGIDTRRFSFMKYGESSDEYLIELAKQELSANASIIHEKKLYEELFIMARHYQWALNVVGCYLSRFLKTARYPQKVFMKVAKPLLFKTGSFSPEEVDLMLNHKSSTGGKIDYIFLRDRLNRTRDDINKYLTRLKNNEDRTQKGPYSLKEDILIMKHALRNETPRTLQEFCEVVKDVSLSSIADTLLRNKFTLSQRWNGYLKPIVLSLFHGTLSNNFLKAFSDYLINTKTESLSQVDWIKVEKLFPSCTKRNLTLLISSNYIKNMKEKMPLYKLLREKRNFHPRAHISKLARKEEVARIFDELRGVLPLSDFTKEVLAGHNLK